MVDMFTARTNGNYHPHGEKVVLTPTFIGLRYAKPSLKRICARFICISVSGVVFFYLLIFSLTVVERQYEPSVSMQ